MRLWSLHPKYLDAKGLVALWREGLLAFAVLQGKTRGYRHHPQLERFKNHPRPFTAIRMYLHAICDEAERRGYEFNRAELGRKSIVSMLQVTSEQLSYELKHLKKKLRHRDPRAYEQIRQLKRAQCHPLLRVVRGGIERWEKGREA